jgi:peptide deformylase
MVLDLAYIGHSILRKKCLPIHTIDQSVLTLVDHMKETVKKFRGLGLAAPQVGAQIALFVACFPIEHPEDGMTPGEPKVFINPQIEDPSKETWLAQEGCLCMPKVYAQVKRPVSITITYQDEHGATHKERLSGWPAKIVMHENDHLNGVLFIDRVEQNEKKSLMSEIERIKKHFKTHNEHLKLWNQPVAAGAS